MKKLNVGISFYIRDEKHSFWENGLFQNAVFMYQLLKELDIINEVYFIIEDFGKPENTKRMLDPFNIKYMNANEALEITDVALELALTYNPEWIKKFKSKKKNKLIAVRFGNDYIIDLTKMLHYKDHSSLFTGADYDAVWSLEQYKDIQKDYYYVGFGVPLTVIPHLWHPMFLEKALKDNPSWGKFGFNPKPKWRIGILEPNQYLLKTFLTPTLITELAYRKDNSFLENLNMFVSLHIKDHPTYRAFANRLNIAKAGKIINSPRYLTPYGVSRFVDCIVSHQIENAQNYVYYEALYGNYPLIHNSPILKKYNLGYYYNGFDAEEGSIKLLEAFKNHEKNLDDINKTNKDYLDTLSPFNVNTQNTYIDLLRSLYPN